MAKGYGRTSQPDVFFVNYDLRSEERKMLKSIIDNEPEKVFEWAEKLVDNRYSITLKWDEYNECVGCFIRALDEKSVNAGLILTGRGKSAFSALAGALYREGVLFQHEWPRHQDRKGLTDDD